MTRISGPAPISHSPRHPAARSPLTALTAVIFRLGLLVVLALPVNASADCTNPPMMGVMATAACSAARLAPGEAPFVNCVRSLQQLAVPTMPRLTRSEIACSALGLVAGTASYSACVANVMATLNQARQLGS